MIEVEVLSSKKLMRLLYINNFVHVYVYNVFILNNM